MDEQDARELRFVADVAIEGRLARNAFGLALRNHGAIVATLRKPPQPQTVVAEAREGRTVRRSPANRRSCGKPNRSSRSRPTLPTPHRRPTLCGASQAFASSRVITGETARLVEIRGEFRQKLAVAEADRNRHADLRFDLAGEARERFGRARAVGSVAAGQIEKRLVDRQRLDQGRELEHSGADFAANARIFGHVGRQYDGLGT